MGIFDDAIRQHLDLKRRQGADEEELQHLEDEAFGPPARPGDPDFPETGEAAAEGEGQAEAPAGSTEATEAPPEPKDEPPAAAVAEPSDDAAPHGDALLADPQAEPEPPPADEGPVEDTGAESFSTTEREAIADQPTEFFDQTPEPLELGELDLDLKDELDEAEAPDAEPLTGEDAIEPTTGEEPAPAEEEPAPAEEESAPVDEEPAPVDEATPIDEMRVVEETEPASEEMPAEPEEESGAESDQAEAGEESAEEAEDVLEETPEFLRDNPDDDELWFEQGEPKDFDF